MSAPSEKTTQQDLDASGRSGESGAQVRGFLPVILELRRLQLQGLCELKASFVCSMEHGTLSPLIHES